ncbi:class I SAM-dependent methyltransferase [Streptomyces cyaneofuscatus]|uniref:class I SAM-dependent methyltransferase n=1 Tax=Streptomyces cyaneofuscatus TaxID=66883 RepID=UPI003662362A
MTAQEENMARRGDEVLAKLWERNYDPHTASIIDALEPADTWRCLDVGAGSGSMSRWLAERVPRGEVLAVDVDGTGFGSASPAPNLTFRKLDVAQAGFGPGSFDFVLARAVVSHLPHAERQLARMADWVAPGGWLLVEDFYFLPSEDAPQDAGRSVVAAYTGTFRAAGADMRIARRLPARLAQYGLTSVDVRVRPLGPGQGADENELMRTRMELHGQALVDQGLVSGDHLAEFVATLDRPQARDVTVLQFSVWGQRPAL